MGFKVWGLGFKVLNVALKQVAGYSRGLETSSTGYATRDLQNASCVCYLYHHLVLVSLEAGVCGRAH